MAYLFPLFSLLSMPDLGMDFPSIPLRLLLSIKVPGTVFSIGKQIVSGILPSFEKAVKSNEFGINFGSILEHFWSTFRDFFYIFSGIDV